jgi:hypothetical protein
MIQIRWKKLLRKTGIWLTTEILLNLIGLDNVADYSEFIFAQELELNKKNNKTVKIVEFPPQFCYKIEEYCPIPGTVFELSDLQAKDRDSKAKILQQKCQKLQHRCIKVISLPNPIASVTLAYPDND